MVNIDLDLYTKPQLCEFCGKTKVIAFLGMVKRCHRTIEDVVRKIMTEQTNWLKMLNSVLFSIWCQTHSSTGSSPMWILLNKDPILPFQHADKMENCPDSEQDMSNDSSSQVDPVVDMIEKLELQRTAIFKKTGSKIAKAQKIYATFYNRKHGVEIQFEIGDKCLKWNKWADSRKAKLKKCFTGPYEIIRISNNGFTITHFF